MQNNNSKDKCSIIKEFFVTCLMICVMLMPGMGLDWIYWNQENCWNSIAVFLQNFLSCRITYCSALNTLNSSVGVLMTLVSLFLTMNINIAERSEKKVYGIVRRDLFPGKHNMFYVYVRRMSYFAPLLLLVFLNLSYCVSGYLLLCYLYLFLMAYYYTHESSYSLDKNLEAVAFLLAGYFDNSNDFEEKPEILYCMRLEEIGKSVKEGADWNGIEQIYSRLRSIKIYDDLNRYMIDYYFYKIVFWNTVQDDISNIYAMQFMRRRMEIVDVNTAKNGRLGEEWTLIWSLFKVTLINANEYDLSLFLKWFLNDIERGRETMRKCGKSLPSHVVKEEIGVLLTLMEYRLRTKTIKSNQLQSIIKVLWNSGKGIWMNEKFEFQAQIRNINQIEIEKDTDEIEKVLQDLQSDYCKQTRRSLIAYIVEY